MTAPSRTAHGSRAARDERVEHRPRRSTSTAPGASDIETSRAVLRPPAHGVREALAHRPRRCGASGDIEIDVHHTVEDVGIVLGQAISRRSATSAASRATATRSCRSTRRSRRPSSTSPAARSSCTRASPRASSTTSSAATSPGRWCGTSSRRSRSTPALTVHVTVLGGRDPHHIAEAEFKAFARAFRQAKALDPLVTRHPVDEGRPVTAHARASSCSTTARATCTRPRRRSSAPAPRSQRHGRPRRGARGRRPRRARRRRLQGRHGRSCTRVRGDEIIDRRLAGGRPVLGICVGMQVLFERGVERGVDTEGLGEWPGVVTELPAPVLPHMGWNTVRARRGLGALRRHRGRALLLRALVRRAGVARSTSMPPFPKPTLTWAEHGGRSSPPSRTARCRRPSSTPRSRRMPASGCSRNWLGSLD